MQHAEKVRKPLRTLEQARANRHRNKRTRGRSRRRRKSRRRGGGAGGGGRGRERQACGRGRRPRRLCGCQVLEQRGGSLFERRGRTFFFLLAGGSLERDAGDFRLGRFGRRDFGGHGIGSRDFRGGATAALRAAVANGGGLGYGLDDLGRGATPLGRRARLLLLALVALPARAHQRHLLVLERRQMTAHEDVHLLEHAHQLLAGDTEFRCQIMDPRRCHSLLRNVGCQSTCQGLIRHSDRLHRRPTKTRSQL